jgi:PAS domain S-box-containing protein
VATRLLTLLVGMGSYTYSGYLWPAFVSTVLVASLGWYGWRHRGMPGGLPFSVACAFAVAWSVGSILQTAAVDPNTQILWLRFLTLWQLPVVTTATCFVMQYAGLGRLLTKRVVMLLAIPPIVLAAFILTDNLHHLMWSGFAQVHGGITPIRGPVNTAALAYSYALALFNVTVLLWLLLKFPRYRWPAVLMIVAQLAARFVFEFGLRLGFPSHWNYGPFVLLFLFGIYAIVLFRFHVFDPVPAARAAAVDQMLEGMIVLDLQGRIVDANAAAQRTLGEPASRLRGRPASEVLPEVSLLPATAAEKLPVTSELSLGEGSRQRHYTLEATPLKDRQGRDLGQMLLLQDVTEQKTAQARLLEQERVVATLQERERLAREFHDGIGQVFGYLSMQAQTVRSRLRAGDGEKADALLARLVQVAQDAHADLRESIRDLKAASSKEWSFIPTLERYLRDFGTDRGIETELAIAEGIDDDTLQAVAAVQVLRVAQEALANAHRHGSATVVRVSIEREDSRARITVADDGSGFDPARFESGQDGHFGLAFMRERMAQIGGQLEIDSRPGAGTRVILEVPLSPGEGDNGESTSG